MKRQRHREIMNIIDRNSIETQEDLAQQLREHGFNVTQATVSRDIKELRLLKILGPDGIYHYAQADRIEQGMSERLQHVFAESVLNVDFSENLIVVKTLPGSAHVAAETIDTMRWPEILGTLAGDNTVLVISRTREHAPDLADRFKGMMR